MSPTSSINRRHNVEPARRRLRAGSLPVAVNDNVEGTGRCPACNGQASIAPIASKYRGQGVVHHHWLCQACGHEWITVLHVSV
jgi:transposase-like protein